MSTKQERTGLPVRGGLGPAYAMSIVVALLMAGASVAGLVSPATVYPTEELRRAFVANDLVNLLLGRVRLDDKQFFVDSHSSSVM